MNIGDDGITAIAKALGKSNIIELGISRCGITFDGMKPLAEALSTSQTITKLRLKQNKITTEGARLITEAAVRSNKLKCLQVYIDDSYKEDDAVKKNLLILDGRKKARDKKLGSYFDIVSS